MARKFRIIKKSSIIFLVDFFLLIILCITKVNLSEIKILQDDFLITFIISVIGIFLTIIALMYALIDKISLIFSDANIADSIKKIYKSFDEMKDNTILIFYLMILIFFIGFLNNIDFPYIHLPAGYNKTSILTNIKLTILLLILFAIHDTIKTFFVILNISRYKNSIK
ncbi:hypothetical protein [Clostridium beijerinckii]|uniref:hypothetical protein n=1 Tax=Clostridium beijerinckii TaxID=1520 RepID=UPI0002D980FA|nr:hypothetical protein [Clostridium beijerinckii]